MPNTIQKTSVSRQVADHILELIERGELKRGDRLPGEREFAESLGISRVPLREAISALSLMGIIEKRHGEGNYIAESNFRCWDRYCAQAPPLTAALRISESFRRLTSRSRERVRKTSCLTRWRWRRPGRFAASLPMPDPNAQCRAS